MRSTQYIKLNDIISSVVITIIIITPPATLEQ